MTYVVAFGRLRSGAGMHLALDLRDGLRQRLITSPRLALIAGWAYTPFEARLRTALECARMARGLGNRQFGPARATPCWRFE